MKNLYTFIASLLIFSSGFAQITGTKNIPGDYTTLASAISDLNTQGVGNGGVTLNLLAGNPQTAPAGGYVVGGTGSAVLTTSKELAQVTIQGNGNTITAYTPQATGSVNDAIFKIIGGDFITIQGFVLQENSSNTAVTPATSNNMTEFGIAVFYVTQTDGSKNVTIQNNTITLNRTYQNSFGIYSSVRHSPTAMTTIADITSLSGSNENLHVYTNNISNVNEGIVVVGSSTIAYMNTGIDIGGTSSSTGNTISNYGKAVPLTAYVSVSTTSVPGIFIYSNLNSNVSWNSISCPGLNTANNMYGILWQSASGNPATAYTSTASHNSISVNNGVATTQIYGIRYDPYQASHNFNITDNDFHDFGYVGVTGSSAVYCIYSGAAANVSNYSNNTFTNLSLNTSGDLILIRESSNVSLAGSTKTINNNSIVTGLTKTVAGGTVYCYSGPTDNSGAGTTMVTNNNFSNVTLTGATAFTGIAASSQAPNKSIHDNTVSNVIGGTSAMVGLSCNFNSIDIYNNTFANFTGGGAITVMSCGGSGATLQNVYSNTIHGISSTGASAVYGIQSLATGASSVSSIYKNNIYDISGSNAGSIVYGIYISAGTTIRTYNNMICDLRTPAANAAIPLAGIYAAGGTNNSVFYNSIYLDGSSTGALFGSAALYSSTSTTLDLRNNVLVNLSTPSGAGVSAAYRRSTSTLTTYSSNSDANDLYAGSTEDASHTVYYDGSAYSISAFKTLVAPRDINSFRELPPFVNVATAPFDIHMMTTVPTLCEGGGLQIVSPFTITDDFDGNNRSSAPDVGADEFAGTSAGIVNPGAFTASTISSQQIDLSFTPNQAGNNVVIVWNLTGIFTTPSGTPPAPGGSLADGTVLYYGTISPYHHTGLTPGTQYFYKSFSYNQGSYSGGVTASATPIVAPPASFTATTVSSTQINLAYGLNTQSNDVLIASNGSSTFGTPVNGTSYSAGNNLPGGGTVIYKGPLSAFSHTGLTPVTTYYYSIWSLDAFNYYSTTGVSANAMTFCTPVTVLPWFEGFENMTSTGTNILPSCWSFNNITGSNYSCSNTCNNNTAHAGTKFIGGAWSFNVWDFTPGIQLTGGVSYDFSFWFKCANATPGYNVSLAYGLLPTPGSMTQILSNETGLNMTEWNQRTLTFTPASSGVYFFGLHDVCPTSGPFGIAFDDFSLQVSSTCVSPASLIASNITTSSVTLSWFSLGSQWEYQVVPTGAMPAPSGILTSSASVAVTGLNPGTMYDFYVRTNCDGTFSTWSGPLTFTTLCSVYPAPFSENFNSTMIPWCWTLSGPQNWEFQHTSPAPSNGAMYVIDHTTGVAGNYTWVDGSGIAGLTGITLTSPAIDVSSLTNPRVKFFLFNNNINSTLPADEQQLTVDIWDGAAWHAGAFIWAYGQNTTGWEEKTISLGTYTITGPVKIRFVVNKGSGSPAYDDLIIDDVSVEQTPDCLYPSNPTVVAGNYYATLNWTAGGTEASWDIEWGPPGFTQGTGTLVSNIQKPYILSGLSPTTAYSYYVRANCGEGHSIWIGPKNFVTLVSCPSPAALGASNLQVHSADLNWTETGTATSWHIEWGPDGFTQGTGTMISGITAKPYTLAGLAPGTSFAFYVRSSCGPGFASEWSGPYTFTTACSTNSTWPWTEGFESLATVGDKIMPPCWSYQNIAGTSGPTSTNLNTPWYGPHKGTRSVFTTVNNTTCMFTPAMELTAGTSYDFSFWMMNKMVTNPVDFVMNVAYGAGNSYASMTHVLASNIVCSNSDYAQFKYTFVPTLSGVYYLGISTTSVTATPHAVSFDDFRLEPTPACPLPTDLTVTSVTSSNAMIEWTGATTVQFEYGPVGHQPGTGTVTQSVSGNPYTLSGLAQATSYDIYVRKDCGGSSYSPWFGPVSFLTLCNATVAPFNEGFEQVSFVPNCWTSTAVSGLSLWGLNTSTSGYGAGSKSAVAAFYSQAAGRTYDLLTMPFDISSLTSPVLRFDYAYATFTGEIDELDVYFSTDYGITWSMLLAMPGGTNGILNTGGISTSIFTPNPSQWATQRLSLPAGTTMIRFRATSAYGNNLYLDNVAVLAPLDHDVAAMNLGLNDVLPLSPVIPTATIRNEGKNAETFSVDLVIGTYTSSRTVTALAPNSATVVTFDTWTPAAGDYSAILSTGLTGDQNTANDVISKPLKAMNLNKTVYGYVASNNSSPDPIGPTTFNLSVPGTLNSIANQSPMPNIGGGTWANGTWYATTADPPFMLTKINPATGARTTVGLIPVNMNGLSFDPANNIMYGVAWDGSHTGLYSVNLVNGFPTYIADCGSHLLINLAINNAGQAYAVDILTDVLGIVNLSNGVFTTIGPLGFDANYAQDMEFDRETGNLYMTAYSTGTSWLALLNKNTGTAMKINNFEGNAEITGFAIPYTASPTLALTGTTTNVTGCFGNSNGVVSTTVSGGYAPYTYLWSTSATTASLTGLTAGIYSVTITDAAQTILSCSWTITQPSAINVTALVSNAACTGSNDGSIALTVSGGIPEYGYLWSSTATTRDISGLAPGIYTVTVTDGTGCLLTASWTIDITDPVCNNVTASGTVSTSVCYNAHLTITVANLTVESPGGHVELIAGQNILLEPGTAVQSGAYLWGHISTVFCTNMTSPVVATKISDEPVQGISFKRFNLYPNPTNSNFTLIKKDNKVDGNVSVEVYNMNGIMVLSERMNEDLKHEFSFVEIPAGLYFVKIISNDYIETIKLIKTR
ncbi:MAG: T9SS type A sorting domain-containing protein [Bacteroidetes bacterium]|nr:T9SS type A sorting domain-containing protein [Bacteroidota bacterium]